MSGKMNWEKQSKLDKMRKHQPQEPLDWRLEASAAKIRFFEYLRAQRMLKKQRKEAI
jgi:hypothetical protein